jgi:hypothetical protein
VPWVGEAQACLHHAVTRGAVKARPGARTSSSQSSSSGGAFISKPNRSEASKITTGA